jgi:uncharacterized protein (TIGR00288 family)
LIFCRRNGARNLSEDEVSEERQKLAVFIDFDNIQIGVKETLGKEFDVSVVLEALKERGEVVTKVAYGDWHRAGDQSRQMSQHAVQMVQRNVTPRGDKNGADINLALDALEMAFTRHHISTFAIVGGDSDFIALVEKLKQYDKRVLIVGGRAFTSGILQRNCHEFISYENLLKGDGRESRPRAPRGGGRSTAETRALAAAQPNLERALKILAEREVAPQIGLLKSTLLQLDPTFSERDYGAGSFLEFLQKMQKAGMVRLARTDRGFLVEPGTVEGESPLRAGGEGTAPRAAVSESATASEAAEAAPNAEPPPETIALDKNAGLEKLRSALSRAVKGPARPLYMRHVLKALRGEQKDFKEQSYGFRSLLDLLHFAERGGVVRLERDRRGVLRIFPTGTPVATARMAEAPALPPEIPLAEAPVVDSTVIEEAAVEPQALPEAPVEAIQPEEEPKAKARKPRSRKSGALTHRRSGARRPSKIASPPGDDAAPSA